MPTRGHEAGGRWTLLALTLIGAFSPSLAACKRKPAAGRPCPTEGVVACADPHRAYVCEGAGSSGAGGAPGTSTATWSAIGCAGAGGCARRGAADDCDDTVATEGDPCPRGAPVDYACSADGSRALACAAGHFALWRACRGPEACRVIDGKDVQCDTSLGQEGDPCGKAGTYACSQDRKTMLVCNGSTLAAASSCSGPGGCQIQRAGHRVDCDDSVAAEGEPCDQTRRITCSADHKSELVCTGGHFAKKRECRRSECRLDGSELFCD